jgi:hypothetical protein
MLGGQVVFSEGGAPPALGVIVHQHPAQKQVGADSFESRTRS